MSSYRSASRSTSPVFSTGLTSVGARSGRPAQAPWTPTIDPDNEAHELVMSVFGGMSKGERNGIKVRTRTAMASQTRLEGRFLGGRPPYGYQLIGLGPHPNPAKAAVPDGLPEELTEFVEEALLVNPGRGLRPARTPLSCLADRRPVRAVHLGAHPAWARPGGRRRPDPCPAPVHRRQPDLARAWA